MTIDEHILALKTGMMVATRYEHVTVYNIVVMVGSTPYNIVVNCPNRDTYYMTRERIVYTDSDYEILLAIEESHEVGRDMYVVSCPKEYSRVMGNIKEVIEYVLILGGDVIAEDTYCEELGLYEYIEIKNIGATLKNYLT